MNDGILIRAVFLYVLRRLRACLLTFPADDGLFKINNFIEICQVKQSFKKKKNLPCFSELMRQLSPSFRKTKVNTILLWPSVPEQRAGTQFIFSTGHGCFFTSMCDLTTTFFFSPWEPVLCHSKQEKLVPNSELILELPRWKRDNSVLKAERNFIYGRDSVVTSGRLLPGSTAPFFGQ